MNDIEKINKSIEKSNLILKKFKLLYQNNFNFDDDKTQNVANELIEHLTFTYSLKNEEICEIVDSYLVDKEIVNNFGGEEITNFIVKSVKFILKEE